MRKDIKRYCETALYDYGKGVQNTPWTKIIKELLSELYAEDVGKARFIELKYFERHSIEKTCELLPCAKMTYAIWREDTLGRLASKAAYKKIIRP